MPADIHAGDRVSLQLDSPVWKSRGWFAGTVVRIDPYSEHRRFYWVELDEEVEGASGGRTRLVSVLNPKNIRRAEE